MRTLLAAVLVAAVPFVAAAQEDDAEWDVNEPHGPTETVSFTTTEGTWMNLDVSPDGSEIVFDMLGDLYLPPIEGGMATRITSGPAFDIQPRFSPDGRRISFTSDSSGGDNIWTIDRDGSDPQQVTDESFRLLNNAVWTPDGEYLIARKHFTSTLNGAYYIGLDHELGSIEEGKLADLVVLSENPLDDLRNSTSITHVMANGRLYDAATMNHFGNHPQTRPTFWFERDGASDAAVWRDGITYEGAHCACEVQ